MNLWVKRIALGLSVAVALFLFACLDEQNVLGFKDKNRKYNISYIEIDVETSNLPFDSLRTSNYFFDPYTTKPDTINRLLAGSYSDPLFGTVEAEAYTQFRPSNPNLAKPTGAKFDSVSLRLQVDYYRYGYNGASTERFSVHELQEDLTYYKNKDYYTNTGVAYDAALLGSGQVIVDPVVFNNKYDSGKLTPVLQLHIPLRPEYGQQLFNAWDPASEDFKDVDRFNRLFKGIAIKGISTKSVLGFSLSTNSILSLHYHYKNTTTGKDSAVKYDFYIANTVSASHLSFNRSGTSLATTIQPYKEFNAADPGKIFVQSGAGLFAKIDISKLQKFADTTQNVVVNSAELSISGIETGGYAPPKSFFMQVLRDDNRLKQLSSDSTARVRERELLALYNNTRTGGRTIVTDLLYTGKINKPNIYTVMADNQAEFYRLQYSSTQKRYSGFMSLFVQELLQKGELTSDGREKPIFHKFVLYPTTASKSVNRVSFNKSDVKLKIYYTTPILKK